MTTIKLAIQKSGRLSEGSMDLIRRCGIKVKNGIGKLKAEASNFPIEFLFLRDDDIPGYVQDGIADIGIIGENVMVEEDRDVTVLHKLGFSRCRLSIAVPKGDQYNGVKDLQDKSIATSYPKILKNYLDEHGVVADIHEISGSVEIAPSIGLADAVCDIVSSGSTLFQNGLKEVEKIFYSEAVMVGSPNMAEEKMELVRKLLFRIKSLQTAESNKYILLNAPEKSIEKIKAVLPGMRSPSILPLAEPGWVSLHSVINENDFWEKIEELKEAGAEGILVVPIEKMIN
ncbi:ATP phosphoribosyltransferase [Limibacter armeniacum]|uniref:ATP phosphoribosyltransferase n=1 Tax=Limibacter armeniacum TaxID=466084 RepID=UPI002FE57E11